MRVFNFGTVKMPTGVFTPGAEKTIHDEDISNVDVAGSMAELKVCKSNAVPFLSN